jgi:Mg-chelatase subunit ChlD
VRFNDGHGEVLALDNPSVGVTCNLATGTPTPTATRGPSPSPTSGAQPTPTATGRPPHRAYLPAAVRSGCLPADSTTDLAILIDVSGSMAAPLPPYPSRWDAAQQAALDVIDALHAMDRVAVLAYADDVWAVQALTSDHEVARRQVARHLPKADGSRLDKGLGRALEELEAGGATAGRIVVFTDGDLNQTDRSSLQAPKEAIRASGVSLAVVLFGEAPDALWRQLAGPMRVWRYGAGTADAVARGARCFR